MMTRPAVSAAHSCDSSGENQGLVVSPRRPIKTSTRTLRANGRR
jgi:hypothetical protein